MQNIVSPQILASLQEARENRDWEAVSHILETLRPADQAQFFDTLQEKSKLEVLNTLNPTDAADIFEYLHDKETAGWADNISEDTLLKIINEMEHDEAADLLDALPDEMAARILHQLEDRDQVMELIAYPEGTAGALMTSVPITVERAMTARIALEAVHNWEADRDTLFYLFVTDRLGRLQGVISLFELIQAPPQAQLSDIMAEDVVRVEVGTDQERCLELFQRYEQITLPVVDELGKIVGLITVDDMVDVMEQELNEDIHHMGAAEPLEFSYLKSSIFSIVRKRAGWLLVLFFAATLTATIMSNYEVQLESVAMLAVFIPLLIDTGGNAGSQTTTTIIRSMATGEIEVKDFLKVWVREIRVGLALGTIMSLLASVLAVVMFQNTLLAVTVSVAIFFIILTANFAGAILPIAARKVGLDPTLLSGPLITTLVDSTGLIIYFSVAKIVFGI